MKFFRNSRSIWLMKWLDRKGFSRRKLKGGFFHRWVGDHILNKDLWLLSKEPIARAWLVGAFIAATPFIGLQCASAILIAMFIRANIPISFAVQWVSNPVTMPPYLIFSYLLGCYVMGQEARSVEEIEAVSDLLFQGKIWEFLPKLFSSFMMPLLLGCTIVGLVVGVVGYWAILFFWPDMKHEKK